MLTLTGVGWVSSHAQQQVAGSNPGQGAGLGGGAQSLVGAHTKGNRSVFLSRTLMCLLLSFNK